MQTLTLSPKQNEYLRKSTKRWGFKIGAVRSGKTYADIAYVIPSRLRAVKDYAGLNVIMGVSRDTIERNVLQPMREIYTDKVVGTINSKNIAMICGAPVYCLGAEKVSQIAKIQGSSIKYCYGDEIAKWNRGVFAMLQSRLDKPYAKFDGSCNPEYPGHWLKEFLENPNIDAYIQKYTIFDNPFLSKEFVDNLCTEYAGTVYYKRYILGEWALAEGLIYPMYADALYAPPDGLPDRWAMSMDYGTQNAFAALLWGKYGDVWYAVDGYYYSGRDSGISKTDEEYGNDIDEFVGKYDINRKTMKTIIDPSAASFIALLRKRGYTVVKGDNDVANGIRDTAVAMQKGMIKVNPSIKPWKKEAEGYVWDESAGDDRPVKLNDHYMDATRYFVETMKLVKKNTDYIPVWR